MDSPVLPAHPDPGGGEGRLGPLGVGVSVRARGTGGGGEGGSAAADRRRTPWAVASGAGGRCRRIGRRRPRVDSRVAPSLCRSAVRLGTGWGAGKGRRDETLRSGWCSCEPPTAPKWRSLGRRWRQDSRGRSHAPSSLRRPGLADSEGGIEPIFGCAFHQAGKKPASGPTIQPAKEASRCRPEGYRISPPNRVPSSGLIRPPSSPSCGASMTLPVGLSRCCSKLDIYRLTGQRKGNDVPVSGRVGRQFSGP